MKRKLLLFLLSALGFSTACNNGKQEIVDMYGTPRIDFRAQGKVTDKSGRAIPGIEVSDREEGKKVVTDQNGDYDISGSTFPKTAYLFFTDIDGPQNGGEFEQQQIEIEFTDEDRTADGSGTWDDGNFTRKDVNVTLKEKE